MTSWGRMGAWTGLALVVMLVGGAVAIRGISGSAGTRRLAGEATELSTRGPKLSPMLSSPATTSAPAMPLPVGSVRHAASSGDLARRAPRLSATQLDDNVEAELEVGCRMLTPGELAAALSVPLQEIRLPTYKGGPCVYDTNPSGAPPFVYFTWAPGPIGFGPPIPFASTGSPVAVRVAGMSATCYTYGPESGYLGTSGLTVAEDPNWTVNLRAWSVSCAEDVLLMNTIINYARDEPPQRPPSDLARTAGVGTRFAKAAWLAASRWWGSPKQSFYPSLAAWDLQRDLKNERNSKAKRRMTAVETALLALAGPAPSGLSEQEANRVNEHQFAEVDRFFHLSTKFI